MARKPFYLEIAESDEILVDATSRFLYIGNRKPDPKRKFYAVYLFTGPFSSEEKMGQLASGNVLVQEDFMPVGSNR